MIIILYPLNPYGHRFGGLLLLTMVLAFFYLSGHLPGFPRTFGHDAASIAVLCLAWGLLLLWVPLRRALPRTMRAVAALLDLFLLAGGACFFASVYHLIWSR